MFQVVANDVHSTVADGIGAVESVKAASDIVKHSFLVTFLSLLNCDFSSHHSPVLLWRLTKN
jgi:hypothetical protein